MWWSVVSDLKTGPIPCCCKQRQRICYSPLTYIYGSSAVDFIFRCRFYWDFSQKKTDNRSRQGLTRDVIHKSFADLKRARHGYQSFFLKIFHVEVSFHRGYRAHGCALLLFINRSTILEVNVYLRTNTIIGCFRALLCDRPLSALGRSQIYCSRTTLVHT